MSNLLVMALLSLGAEAPADVVVVLPQPLAAAFEPWLAHRAAYGCRFAFVSNEQSPEAIRADIRRHARSGPLRGIVLVGDVDAGLEALRSGTGQRMRGTPTYLARAKVNVLWGSEPDIATDNWYADLDDDQLPDVPIGRLSADTPEQLATIVEKIIAYEASPPGGPWRRRVNIVAGVGGFGPVVDTVIESATRKFLTEGIPAAYETSVTYGSWQSPFCPDPRQFHDTTVERLNEGSLFWLYIGHGQRRYLDRVRTPGGSYHIFDTDDISKLQRRGGAPIAVFLACYTGAFDEPRDCLAEELLRAKEGPTAVLCGSRVTMPYAMAVLGHELMDECFRSRRPTLGEMVLHAKRRMARSLSSEEEAAHPNRHLLDAIAAAISPAPDLLDEERREHLLLFNLLGDPLLKLPRAEEITLQAAEEIRAGEKLSLQGHTPLAGRGRVELVLRRDRQKTPFAGRSYFSPTDDALAEYTAAYAHAHDLVWAVEELACEGGEFAAELAVPANAHGPCHVRVFLERDGSHGMGTTPVFVRRKTP